MEAVVKKYQQKFNKVKQEMQHWEELQSRLVLQFSNASSIIQRLQLIGDEKNFGRLRGIPGIQQAVLRKQLESLENILLSIKKTMEELHGIVLSLAKMVQDGRQLVKGVSATQLKQRVGIKPSLSDCLDGLIALHKMHNDEYILKTSLVSALVSVAYKSSVTGADLGAMQQLLVDQANIPKDQVQIIFDVIFSEEIC